MILMVEYPELDELVMATVKKILPFGAILSLDEYGNQEAFLHISEVARGWTRSVSEHLKAGQKVVVKVIRLEPQKRQVDVSRKRVSEGDRKRKTLAYKSFKRATKLLERVALKLGKTLPDARKEVGDALEKEFGDLYTAFEELSAGVKPKSTIPKKWLDALREVAEKEIKQREVELHAQLTLQCFGSGGLKRLEDVLVDLDSAEGVSVLYLGAPKYSVSLTAEDFKEAEKRFAGLQEKLEAVAAKQENIAYSLKKKKE